MKKRLLLFFLPLLFLSSQNLLSQPQHFQGNWTKVETTYIFEFDLYLQHSPGNEVTGFFEWTVVQADKSDIAYYKKRMGTSAKEFVKGHFDPSTNTYKLSGYKKDDPHQIISLDDYILKLDKYGDIGGDTKTSGSWLGKINGKRVGRKRA